MAQSRMKKAILNTYGELTLEVVTAVCSFILPRLILSYFGSKYNGITSSISQFIGCVALLKSGIGSVTRASLYKPLAEKDYDGISAVVGATQFFMRKIALIFLGVVVLFAGLYPFIVSNDFDWFFSFTLVLILSISTFAQYYFGLTYQMLIQADQKNYVIALTQIAVTILNTLVSSILIVLGCGIHVVKLGSAMVFLISPLFYSKYAKKKYHLNKKVQPNMGLISQRWDAFAHQLANFVNTNTDVMVITIFLGVGEVSVYTVYYMVCNAVRKVINAFSAGMTAAFGNMLAKNENEVLEKRFSQFELLVYAVATILFTTTAILLVPFVMIYTSGITDVNYNRSIFGYLICVAEFFACAKIPYETLTFSAGRFKETRNGAFIEAVLNIVISVTMVNIVGIEGVVIGTIIAIAFRTLRYNHFVAGNIVKKSEAGILKYLTFCGGSSTLCIFLSRFLPLSYATSFVTWIPLAAITFLSVTLIVGVIALILFREKFVELVKFLLSSVLGRKRRKSNAK